MNGTRTNQILDIGGGDVQSYNKALLEKKLFWSQGPFTTIAGHVQRVLPTSIIYGDKGLELWSSITHLPSYYQTRGEAALLVGNSQELARWIQKDSVLIDLGCGYVPSRCCLSVANPRGAETFVSSHRCWKSLTVRRSQFVTAHLIFRASRLNEPSSRPSSLFSPTSASPAYGVRLKTEWTGRIATAVIGPGSFSPWAQCSAMIILRMRWRVSNGCVRQACAIKTTGSF